MIPLKINILFGHENCFNLHTSDVSNNISHTKHLNWLLKKIVSVVSECTVHIFSMDTSHVLR